MNRKPLIAHVLYRLDTGGMEHMLITVLNNTKERYRHAVICLSGFSAVRKQIEDADVLCLSLNKKPGKDWGCYFRLWRTLKLLRPDMVHTYNFGALDVAPIAKLAGISCVIHAERGRDAADPRGENRKYRRLRRWLAPFIVRYLTVSKDLQSWLISSVGIKPSKIVCIPNGIDTGRFAVVSRQSVARPLLNAFAPVGTLLIGTVGRLNAVKDQAGLITAFRGLCDLNQEAGTRLRLVIVGEGNERQNLEQQITRLNLTSQVCLLGNREDIAELLAECDIFALSSIAEGMPGALLEAMAAGLPIVATNVGGVREVVVAGMTGILVEPHDPAALAEALDKYIRDSDLRQRHGRAGRARVETHFSLSAMLSAYVALYDELLSKRLRATHSSPPSRLAEHKEH